MNKLTVACLTVGVAVGSLGLGMGLQAALFDVPERGASHVAPELTREAKDPRALPGVEAPTNRTDPEAEKVTSATCNEVANNIITTYRRAGVSVTKSEALDKWNRMIDAAVPELNEAGAQLNRAMKYTYSHLASVIFDGKYAFTNDQLYNYAYQVCDLNVHKTMAKSGV